MNLAEPTGPEVDPPPFPPVRRGRLSTLQVNVGYRCNQACAHCHVDAGPSRTEQMSLATWQQVLAFAQRQGVETIDLTGGAPELHPHFRRFVRDARAAGCGVIDRCNLTVLMEPGQESLAAFLASEGVRVVASLPCYGPENVDAQRGKGVFDRSLDGLRALNAQGYGSDPALQLDLVYNPLGPHLPPSQSALESTYRTQLAGHGVHFNRLLTLANVPIARFRRVLEREGHYEDYLRMLVDAHREANLAAVMCRTTLSVDWQGRAYDCDFNQMLGLPLGGSAVPVPLQSAVDLDDRAIGVGPHCYACTAGAGSSCGGALQAP